jgi:hypothetical protein
MTREESKKDTIKKIRSHTCGKDITDAMLLHFRTYVIPELKTAPVKKEFYDELNTPLLSGFIDMVK